MSGAAPPIGAALPRSFFRRHPLEVAPDLLNKLLVVADGRAGRIVEVEAYCGAGDPASHAYRGPTARNATMFGPPGHLYVYFSYGVHWCANTSCGDHDGLAVLFRALAPVSGLEAMREARGNRTDRDLARGPGRLTQALGIVGSDDGADLVSGAGGVWVASDGVDPPSSPAVGPRVGLSKAADRPWRFWVEGDPHVSRRPRPALETRPAGSAPSSGKVTLRPTGRPQGGTEGRA